MPKSLRFSTMTRSPHLTRLPFVRYTTLTEVSNAGAETLAEALVAGSVVKLEKSSLFSRNHTRV